MTNPSFPKTGDTPTISDLIAPAQRGKARVGTDLPGQDFSPAAQRFDQVLQRVTKRSTPDRPEPAHAKESVPARRASAPRSEVRSDRSPSRRPERPEAKDRSDPSGTSDPTADVPQADGEAGAVERDESADAGASSQGETGKESAETSTEDSAASKAIGEEAGDEPTDESASSTSAIGQSPESASMVSDAAGAAAETDVVEVDPQAVHSTATKSPVALPEGSADASDQELAQLEGDDQTETAPVVGAPAQPPIAAATAQSEDAAAIETAGAVEAEGAESSFVEAGRDAGAESASPEDGGAEAETSSDDAAPTESSDQPESTHADPDSDGAAGQNQPSENTESADAPQSAIGTRTSSANGGLAASVGAGLGAASAGGAATPAGAAGEAAAAGRVLDAEDGDQLWHQVRRAIGSLRTNSIGEQQMTIRLRPAELGSVMVRISTGEAGTTVALVTESAAAANQLNQQRQQLISELEEGGLSDVAVDVGTSGDTQEHQTEESSGDLETGDGTRRSTIGIDQDGEPVDRFRSRRVTGTQSHLVDIDL